MIYKMIDQMIDNHTDKAKIQTTVDELYRSDSRRIYATLVRLLNDFDLAEEMLQEAFAVAVEQWCRDGIPSNPRSWIVSTARFKAIDSMRRRARFDKTVSQYGEMMAPCTTEIEDTLNDDEDFNGEETFDDDHLRLIFTCCHPALSANARIALTLRETCGLTTEEIATPFFRRRLPSPSASCALKQKFAIPKFLMKCRHTSICTKELTRFSQ